MRFLALWLFAAAALAAEAVPAQQVTNVAGGTVTLSMGSDAGVRVGATGKLCARQSVGGREAEICSAVFEVVRVDRATAQAKVMKGDARSVAVGMRVRFDKAPEPARSRAKAPARSKPAVDDPLALVEAADRALADGRSEEAVGLYRKVLELIPGDPYATAQLAKGEEARRDQLLKEEIRRRRKENATKVAYLEKSLEKATQAGDADSQQSYAQMILEIDPFDPEAVAVREEIRKAADARAGEAAVRWDEDAYLAAWRGFSTDWKEPDALAKAEARVPELFEAPFRKLDALSCGEMPAAFNRFSEELRGSPGFRRRAQAWLARVACGVIPLDLTGVAGGPAGLAHLVLVREAAVEQEFVVRIEPAGEGGEAGKVFEAGSAQIAEPGLVVLIPAGREFTVSVLPAGERKKGEPEAERKVLPALQSSEVKRICVGKGGILRRALALKLDSAACGG